MPLRCVAILAALVACVLACTQPKLDPPTSACAPSRVDSVLAFVPPPNRAAKCTAGDLTQLRATCFDPATSDRTACAAWGAGHPGCFDCALSSEGDGEWGPLVAVDRGNEVDLSNVGGCIAVLSPANEACGEKVQAELQCILRACGRCEVAPAADYQERQADVESLNGCFDAALKGTCSSYAAASSACLSSVDPRVVATCQGADDSLDGLFAVLGVMCGDASASIATDGGPGGG
jgi:hypothetical protein